MLYIIYCKNLVYFVFRYIYILPLFTRRMLVEYFCDEENGLRLRDASGKTLVLHKRYRSAVFIPHEEANGSYRDIGAPLVEVDAGSFNRFYSLLQKRQGVPGSGSCSVSGGLEDELAGLEREMLEEVRESIISGMRFA